MTREGDPLTAIETQVLIYLAKGFSNREVGRYLDRSQHTIGDHIKSIYLKIGADCRAAAAVWACRNHLLGEDTHVAAAVAAERQACAQAIRDKAAATRLANTHRGRVNLAAEFAASQLEEVAKCLTRE